MVRILVLLAFAYAHAAVKIKKTGERSYLLAFGKGDEIVATLEQFAKKNDIKGAHFHAIGALRSVSFGWFDEKKKKYLPRHIDTPVELSSLDGDIALVDGKPQVHAHVNVADSAGNVHGGHLFSGTVFPTAELFLETTVDPLVKTHDDETGLNLF